MDKILIPAGLDSVRDMKDRSCKMTFITRELENNEFALLRDIRGAEGWLLFSLNEVQEKDIPEEAVEEVEGKTPSQRLRSVLFVLWKQSKSELDFNIWYRSKMESIIQAIKNKLD
jgi:hypothetical protein